MSTTRLWPTTDWLNIRKNVREAPVLVTVKVSWYRVIHDIIPPHTRLHQISLNPTDFCDHCNRLDSLQHRLEQDRWCGKGRGHSWRGCYAPNGSVCHPNGYYVAHSPYGPLRNTELCCGCLLTASRIACNDIGSWRWMTTISSSFAPDRSCGIGMTGPN